MFVRYAPLPTEEDMNGPSGNEPDGRITVISRTPKEYVPPPPDVTFASLHNELRQQSAVVAPTSSVYIRSQSESESKCEIGRRKPIPPLRYACVCTLKRLDKPLRIPSQRKAQAKKCPS